MYKKYWTKLRPSGDNNPLNIKYNCFPISAYTGGGKATSDFEKRKKCAVSLIWSRDDFGHTPRSLAVRSNGRGNLILEYFQWISQEFDLSQTEMYDVTIAVFLISTG